MVQFVEKSDDMNNAYFINECAWNVFQRSNNKDELRSATSWIRHIFQIEPNNFYYVDTYANLLYKVGRIDEAIFWEEKSLKIATDEKSEDYMKMFQEVIVKMKKGEPTWLVSEEKPKNQ